MDLNILGISHRNAAVETREKFSLPGELCVRFLRAVRGQRLLREAVVLNTCNRLEVYYVPHEGQDGRPVILEQLRQLKGLSQVPQESMFYHHSGVEAAGHLFEVAASLDSLIVGEHQILGQLKDAYSLATAEATTGFLLNKAMHWAFKIGKRVQTETQLGRGSASVAQAAVELAGKVFGYLEGRSALLVGAGQTAKLAARALLRTGVTSMTVANRTLENAARMSQELCSEPSCDEAQELDETPEQQEPKCRKARAAAPDAEAATARPRPAPPQVRQITLDEIPSVLSQVDFVIASSGASDFVLCMDNVGEALRRIQSPLVIIDVAVPRNVDPALARLPNVFLYNIDDLDRLVAHNIQKRQQEIPRARAIVQHELGLFAQWCQSQDVRPMVILLQQYFEAMRQAEIKRYGKQFNGQSENLDLLTQSMCSKLLHKPLKFLNALPQDGKAEAMAAIDLIRRMFDLDSLENKQ